MVARLKANGRQPIRGQLDRIHNIEQQDLALPLYGLHGIGGLPVVPNGQSWQSDTQIRIGVARPVDVLHNGDQQMPRPFKHGIKGVDPPFPAALGQLVVESAATDPLLCYCYHST
jgi:hypothetical protein